MNRIILISGKLRSGKNQLAEYLTNEFESHGKSVRCDLFAKGVKDGAREDFKALTDYLNDMVTALAPVLATIKHTGDAKDFIMNGFKSIYTEPENFYEDKTPLTRILLQLYGTDIFRNRVDDNYWLKQLIDRCIQSTEYVTIVTDVRFPNEITYLQDNKDLDVCTIRVERDMKRTDKINQHPSETALDNFNDWNFVIDNNGTLKDLDKHSTDIYNTLQLIQTPDGQRW